MGKEHSCPQSFDPSDQPYGLRELWLQAEDNGQAQFVHSQIYEALQKIRSTVICSFQLWSHLELLIHCTGQKDENKKKRTGKIDMRVGEKVVIFAKIWGIWYTQNLTHNHLHVHRNKHIVNYMEVGAKKIASLWNWKISMCRTTVSCGSVRV